MVGAYVVRRSMSAMNDTHKLLVTVIFWKEMAIGID